MMPRTSSALFHTPERYKTGSKHTTFLVLASRIFSVDYLRNSLIESIA